MSKKPAETTIRTSIRIRPCSDKERETYPGPSVVQAAPGEVRLYPQPVLHNNGSTGGRPRETNPGNKQRPSTPTKRPTTPGGLSGSAAAQAVWQAVHLQSQQLGTDYQSYPFANVFGPEADNNGVYNGSGCKDIVDSVLRGCNGTIFVYGQTGAGKTHTMDAFTQLVLQQLYTAAARDDSNCEVSITLSAVELYNEVLRCLLSGRENLQLRMGASAGPGGPAAGVVLEGADERPCSTCEEAAALVDIAKSSRSVGETRANARSSRSHLIVRIKVEVLQLSSSIGGVEPGTSGGSKGGPASVSFSLLNLVDLAGSERIDKSGSSDTPLRLREALNINKSLLCLGNVVTALAERSEGRKNTHIPYRDSKLTRLLEDSLGGNAATALLACITPLPEWHLEQTRATLEFAARAARVVCSPQRNVLKLLPNPAAADSSALIAELQAEVAALKALLAQHQDSEGGSCATAAAPCQLQSHTWDSCSSSSSGAMADAAAAAEAATAAEAAGSGGLPVSPRNRAKWTNRLRLSVGGGASAARAAAAAAAAAAGGRPADGAAGDRPGISSSSAGAAAGQTQDGSSAAQIHSSRSTATHGSLLWKFFHVKAQAAADKLPLVNESSPHSGFAASGLSGLTGSHSLRSTGLLMTSAVNTVNSTCSSSGAGSLHHPYQTATGPGMLSRWATFHSSSYQHQPGARGSSEGGRVSAVCSSSGGNSQCVLTGPGYRSHGSSHGGSLPACLEAGAGISSQVAAAEAAMALRDHIIKQLVTALQQKKAEIKALRDAQVALQRQLEQAEGEGVASKQKLRELAEGIQALAAAREEEFEKWKGHLEGVEVALQTAQQESLTYRQEALALVQQLTQLQARYRSLQSDQLRRSSLIQSANHSILMTSSNQTELVQLQTVAAQQGTQLSNCLTSLLGIEECLRRLVTQTAAPLTHTGSVLSLSLLAPVGTAGDTISQASPAVPSESQLHPAGTSGTLSGTQHLQPCSSSAARSGEISSHMINTMTTRYDMNSSLVTTRTTLMPLTGPKGTVQLEELLDQLQGILPLVRKAAASATAAAGPIVSAAAAAASVRTALKSKESGLTTILSCSSTESDDASPKIAAGRGSSGTGDAAGGAAAAAAAAKCHKCDSLKPLLALMQKLKDEVVSLKAAVKSRDAQLAAAAATSAGNKRDLEESRQQVGSLQERIDELAEELEAARSAASAAAASTAHAATRTPEDAAAAAAAGSAAGSEPESPGTQLSRECSSSRVPLMSDDTPLEELHAQILMSWHMLAMPRTYRTAFVLGHGPTPESSPWGDRAQCQAHVALLACLHQLQEDQPSAGVTQQSILAEEAALLDAGLARMEPTEHAALVQQWSLADGLEPAAKRAALLAKIWTPCSATAADQLAAASAAACRLCLSAAPPVEMAALTIRSNASLMAATSNALAEAAS